MIDFFRADNFKSLVDFEMPLSRFNVLIGMNGAGKTTILQALDFLSQIMHGKVDAWLANRNWTAADLNSKLLSTSTIELRTTLTEKIAAKNRVIGWTGAFNRRELACLFEAATALDAIIPLEGELALQVQLLKSGQNYYIDSSPLQKITFTYQGSILSQLLDSELTPELRLLCDRLRNIRSLELLSPHLMRQKARGGADDIGFGGENSLPFYRPSKRSQA